MARGSSFLFLCLCLVVAGCSANGLTFPEPEGELTVVGGIQMASASGITVFYGTVINTGDVEVEDIFISIQAFSAGGALLGTFRDVVSRWTTETGVDNMLDVNESGSFIVPSNLPFGAVGRTEHFFDFTIPLLEENEES